MKSFKPLFALSSLLLAFIPLNAWAHVGFAANDLYAGMFHPLLHLPTALPMIALTLWITRQPVNRLSRLISTYLVSAIIGASILWFWPVNLVSDTALLSSAVLLGLIVVFDRQLALSISFAIALVTGFVIGADNMMQYRDALVDPLLYMTGVMLTAGLLLLHLVTLLHQREQLWIRTGIRIMSSWIVTAAILVLALRWSNLAMVATS